MAEEELIPRTRLAVAAILLACLGVLGACRGATAERVYGNDRGADAAGPVAAVGGRRVTKGDLADFWFARYTEEYGRTLNALIDQRIVAEQAARLGLGVPGATLAQAVAAEEAARRKQLKTLYGDDADLAAEVRRAYGVDLDAWRRTVLRPRLRSRLLLERVVRLDTRSRERVHARVIVVHAAAAAARIVRKLRQGADFSLTALRESRDPTARRGGDLPLIARGDLAFPGVEERLFAAAPGALVGPLEVRVAGRPQWQIYKIVDRRPPWPGGPAARIARLESDLAAHPLGRAEFERWQARMRRDHDVRYYRPDGSLWRPPAGR